MILNPNIWFNYYKFIMTTISLYYPKYPNDVTKKKYYNFIQNIPLFFPEYPLGNNYIKHLEFHPLTPYLDSRESFIKWIHYINNKIGSDLKIKEDHLEDALKKYYDIYKPPEKNFINNIKKKFLIDNGKKNILIVILIILIILIINFL